MNFSTTSKANNRILIGVAALAALLWPLAAQAASKPKGIDIEIPYEATLLKTPGLKAPYYLNPDGHEMVVSDQAGGVFRVTMAGKVTELAGKAKVKHPAGVAIAPAGFGSYAGQVFVLTAADPKSACEVDRIDNSGAVSKFADLPDAAGGKAIDCRDLEFGPAGSPYAGKLYAETSANSTIYAIDSTGKASVFGSYDKPLGFELMTIGFLPSNDPKAPNAMLAGMRPKMGGASKIGRLGVIGADGKLKDDPYLVGFIRPTGFGYSPGGWGSYPNAFFIADTGKLAEQNHGEADGTLLRVYKGVARPFAGRLVDPTCLKFIGNKMVLCDPAAKGKAGDGAIVVISSML
jgi:hypothetical protein